MVCNTSAASWVCLFILITSINMPEATVKFNEMLSLDENFPFYILSLSCCSVTLTASTNRVISHKHTNQAITTVCFILIHRTLTPPPLNICMEEVRLISVSLCIVLGKLETDFFYLLYHIKKKVAISCYLMHCTTK